MAKRQPKNSDRGKTSPAIIELFSIEITWNLLPEKEIAVLPPIVREQMNNIYDAFRTDPRAVLPELRLLTARYPQVSCLQNWLINALRKGSPIETEEALNLSDELFRKKPDYFFARTTLAEILTEKDDVEKAADLMFGEQASFARLYPGRKVFHISEVRHWSIVCCKIKILQGDAESARSYRDMLNDIEPDTDAVAYLDHLLASDLAMVSKLRNTFLKVSQKAKKNLRKA